MTDSMENLIIEHLRAIRGEWATSSKRTPEAARWKCPRSLEAEIPKQ